MKDFQHTFSQVTQTLLPVQLTFADFIFPMPGTTDSKLLIDPCGFASLNEEIYTVNMSPMIRHNIESWSLKDK